MVKCYKIWANGRIEGFEDLGPCIVINRIPVLLAQSYQNNPANKKD